MLQRILSGAVVAVILGAPGSVLAQDAEESTQPNVVALSEWKCDWGELGDIVELANGTVREVWEELEDEGMIDGWGILTHAWGDEYNLVLYTLAQDVEGVMAASNEYFRRIAERDPENAIGDQFTDACREHRDNIYNFQYPSEDGDAS